MKVNKVSDYENAAAGAMGVRRAEQAMHLPSMMVLETEGYFGNAVWFRLTTCVNWRLASSVATSRC